MIKRRFEKDPVPPLPRAWLPDPLPPDDSARWDGAVQSILSASEPSLAALATADDVESPAWWALLGRWWAPAAGLATATAGVLLLFRLDGGPVPDAGSVPLSLAVSGGDPAALWEGLGIPADPVLAMLALHGADR